MVRAVFFDRDGVLNELVERKDGQKTAPWDIDEFKILDGAKEAVQLVKNNGYKTFVVTNQPDVKDGYLDKRHLDLMHKICMNWIGIDSVMYASDRESFLYKPNNGMIEYYINMFNIDRDKSFLIGDRWKDIVAGHKSKISTIFIGEDYTYPYEYRKIQPDYIVDNALQAAMLIAELHKND